MLKVTGDPIKDSWFLMHQMNAEMERCEDKLFKNIGILVGEYQVLSAIKTCKTNVTPTKINEILNKDPNYISFLLKRLEKAGFINRKKDLGDRRLIRLEFTENGKKIYQKTVGPAERLPKALLSSLSEKELLVYIGLIQKIRARIKKYRYEEASE
jgi:DNA-binding MarR family transcriptional regulator